MPETGEAPYAPNFQPITKSPRKPLIGQFGVFDREALIAWVDDGACWKTYMPDDEWVCMGIREGDLLITDPDADWVVGGLAVVVLEMMFTYVGVVSLDEDGKRWVRARGYDFLLDDDGSELLCMALCGFVPMAPDAGELSAADMDRAQLLPLYP